MDGVKKKAHGRQMVTYFASQVGCLLIPNSEGKDDLDLVIDQIWQCFDKKALTISSHEITK